MHLLSHSLDIFIEYIFTHMFIHWKYMLCYAVLSHFSHGRLCNPMDCSPLGSSVHGDSPGKNTGVGCHALLQGIFLTQGSSPRLLSLLHWQMGSLP